MWPRRSAASVISPGSASPMTRLLADFLPLYYSELPEGDVDDRKLDDIYAVAVAHLAVGRRRAPGETIVRLISPDRERDGWHSPHSVLLVVTDDMPFLVDTMRMVLERHGLEIHLLVHPMLTVERRDDEPLVVVDADDGLVEAWTQIEIDRIDEATARAVQEEVVRAIEDVRLVVDDFPAMRMRMDELGAIDPLLPWLAEGQFVFLGAADYDRAADGTLTLRQGSGLGKLRQHDRIDPPPVPGDRPVVIARSDATATVFRAERHTVVIVRPDDATERRFVGLLATNAYRVSVLDIPRIGADARRVLDLTEARMHAHAGRATRTVLENLPRDLVLELEPEPLGQLVNEIVGLQERQLVRVFEVPDPVGPWATVLVYLPRNRFTAELPERVADAVADAYGADGADQRTFESLVGASSLARIAVSVRRPSTASGIDVTVLERTIDELSTSWPERLRAALVGEFGEEAGVDLFDRVGSHAPAAYRAAVAPERATGDVRRIASLLDGADEFTTSLGHEIDAPPGEWRFRVYRQGSSGGALRTAPAPRPPGPRRARRAAVHVPRRRREGVPLRHRREDAVGGRPRRPAMRSSCSPRSPRSSPARWRATASTASCWRPASPRARSRSCGRTPSTCARWASASVSRTSRTRSTPTRVSSPTSSPCSTPGSIPPPPIASSTSRS